MKITKASVAWSGLLSSVVRAIEAWKPKECATELEYRDVLVRHLRGCAPEARVEPEYRHAGTTADVRFKWEGFIGIR
jgi:predicted alpha/beta-fold hydrolase